MKIRNQNTLLQLCLLSTATHLSLSPLSYAQSERVNLHVDYLHIYSTPDSRDPIDASDDAHAIYADAVILCDQLQEQHPVLYFGDIVSQDTGARINLSVLSDLDIGDINSTTGMHLSGSRVGNLTVDKIDSQSQGLYVNSSDVGSIVGEGIITTSDCESVSALHIKSSNRYVGFDRDVLASNVNHRGRISIDMHAVTTRGTAYGVYVETSNANVGALRGVVEIYARGENQSQSYAWRNNDSSSFINVLADDGEVAHVSTYGNVHSHGLHVDEGCYMKMIDVGQNTKISQYDIQGSLDIVISHEAGVDQLQAIQQGVNGMENIRVFGGVMDMTHQATIKLGQLLEFETSPCRTQSIKIDENPTLIFRSNDDKEMLMSFDVNHQDGVSISSVMQQENAPDNSLGWNLDLTMNEGDAFMMSVYVDDMLMGLDTDEFSLYHLTEDGERIDLDASHVSYFDEEGLLNFSVEHEDTNAGSLSGPIMFSVVRAIPEPSSAVLSLLGLVGLCAYRRRA